MNLEADALAMLTDFTAVVKVKGVAYKGQFNHEVHNLEGGVDRIPTLLMRTTDVEAAGLVRESDVSVDGTVYQCREFQRQDDGVLTLIALAT